MSSSIIRAKHVLCKVKSRTETEIVDDGAIYQRDGIIREIGAFDTISKKYPDVPVLGSGEDIVAPGFVNGHHHVGLTPFQLGSMDYALERWFASRMGSRAVDFYLDTLYSAFEMVESGITTVQHLRGFIPGKPDNVLRASEEIIRAYQDLGMRVSYSYFVRDQMRMLYEHDADFLKRLPADLSAQMADFFKDHTISLDESFGIFTDLHGKYNSLDRVRIQLGPANLHWCSDACLKMLRDHATRYKSPMHMHLLETVYQKEYARRRTGMTAVAYLKEFDLLGPDMTLGHGTWLNQADVDLCAQTGTCICHNCSSNLRLRSGVAPLNAFEKAGLCVCIGLDEAGINDDRDMLQEMRMVLRQHRVPGFDDLDVPTSHQVLRMATEDGARTTSFAGQIGTLEVGKACDLVMMNWRQISYPYLDSGMSIVDALLYRAKASGVGTVLVAGEPIYRDGRFTRVNKDEALAELAASLEKPLTAQEKSRHDLGYKIMPYVEGFYEGYLDGQKFVPFYDQSSRT